MLLETRREGLTLRRLTPSDAAAYVLIMRAYEAHLTRLGDYGDEMTRSVSSYAK